MNRIAVVVPAHDERDLLPACLAALAVDVADSLMRAAAERWRLSEATSARARARADALEAFRVKPDDRF